MALNAYLKLKANGTDLPGESTKNGYENWIEVESFSWGAVTSRDAGGQHRAARFSGAAAGRDAGGRAVRGARTRS